MSHFVIQDWMVKNLNLKGLERDIYAIIYGFTQDNESKFYGSLNYLSQNTGYSKQAVLTSIKKLIEKDLIVKYENDINGIKTCKYSINFNSIKETLTPIKETLPNNINNNINNTFLNNKLFKNNNTKSGTDLYSFCINCIDDFCINKTHEKNLRKTLIQYLNFRLEVKEKPLYKNMWKGMLEKLQNCYEKTPDNITYTDIVLYNLNRGYLTFYAGTEKNNINVENNIHWDDKYDLDTNSYATSKEKF